MKRFFRTLAFVAVATVSAFSISSCSKDDDDSKEIGESSGTSAEAFYNGLMNNTPESTIVIDTRPADKYAAGHVIRAKSIPVSDNAFYDDTDAFYSTVEALDPTHSKFILLTDEGASPLMVHVAGVLSEMGWGKEKIYLLTSKTSDFLKKYPDAKSPNAKD